MGSAELDIHQRQLCHLIPILLLMAMLANARDHRHDQTDEILKPCGTNPQPPEVSSVQWY